MVILNAHNEEEKCFLWSVLAALHAVIAVPRTDLKPSVM